MPGMGICGILGLFFGISWYLGVNPRSPEFTLGGGIFSVFFVEIPGSGHLGAL